MLLRTEYPISKFFIFIQSKYYDCDRIYLAKMNIDAQCNQSQLITIILVTRILFKLECRDLLYRIPAKNISFLGRDFKNVI